MSDKEVGPIVTEFWRTFLDSDVDSAGVAALSALVTPEVRFRGSLGATACGAAEIAAYCRQAKWVFRDFDITVGEVIGDGDRVAARLLFSGYHQEALLGIAPTGKRIEYDGMAWMRLEGDRLADIWVMGDAAEWMGLFRAQG